MGNKTIKDIALALDLSPSTVSRALRNSYEINEKTRKLVSDYATMVNYRRNSVALSLRQKRTLSIGIIVPKISNNFFSDVINGIEDEAYTRGYQVLIFQSHESYEREALSVQHLYDRRVDGLLISLSGKTENVDHIQKFSKDDLRVVYFDRVPVNKKTDKVIVDNFQGAYEATKWMIQKGIKKIAVTSSPPNIFIAKERLEGYKKALEDHSLSFDENLVKYCGFEPVEAFQAMEELLLKEKVGGILANADRLTLDCYTAYKELYRQKRCKQVAFFGFTNLNVASLLDPPLHAIVQPAYNVGIQACKLLLDRLEYEPEKPLKYVKPMEPAIQHVLQTTLQIHP